MVRALRGPLVLNVVGDKEDNGEGGVLEREKRLYNATNTDP